MKPMSSQHHHTSSESTAQSRPTKVGSVTVMRSTKSGKSGVEVTVKVVSAQRSKLMRETTKQIRALVEAPISAEQRQKAQWLAKKAKDAQSSAITAKFRKTA